MSTQVAEMPQAEVETVAYDVWSTAFGPGGRNRVSPVPTEYQRERAVLAAAYLQMNYAWVPMRFEVAEGAGQDGYTHTVRVWQDRPAQDGSTQPALVDTYYVRRSSG